MYLLKRSQLSLGIDGVVKRYVDLEAACFASLLLLLFCAQSTSQPIGRFGTRHDSTSDRGHCWYCSRSCSCCSSDSICLAQLNRSTFGYATTTLLTHSFALSLSLYLFKTNQQQLEQTVHFIICCCCSKGNEKNIENGILILILILIGTHIHMWECSEFKLVLVRAAFAFGRHDSGII